MELHVEEGQQGQGIKLLDIPRLRVFLKTVQLREHEHVAEYLRPRPYVVDAEEAHVDARYEQAYVLAVPGEQQADLVEEPDNYTEDQEYEHVHAPGPEPVVDLVESYAGEPFLEAEGEALVHGKRLYVRKAVLQDVAAVVYREPEVVVHGDAHPAQRYGQDQVF